jgi:hypothetical protein
MQNPISLLLCVAWVPVIVVIVQYVLCISVFRILDGSQKDNSS